ncbi:inositol polyphosphate kinase domain-containing protein [Ditylenchus destructor]|uniref:Kinase n=1 Tax=Ditylenchus destructor TaxID=166010 RepID=A0AAD4NGG1_9BILA|nr:inositol polyphosphate kinase domain-containing protein [Ditylenchus destructor]
MVRKKFVMTNQLLDVNGNEIFGHPLHSSSPHLKPFKHQVGGHGCIFSVDSKHICKEFLETEASFYAEMPEELRPLTADCCYDAELAYDEDTGEHIFYVTRSIPFSSRTQHHCSSNVSSTSGYPLVQLADTVEVFRDVSSGMANPVNPWAFHCQLKSTKIRKEAKAPKRFLMFENLAAKYKHPCIVDFKLGTRQYGDNVSDKKKWSHIFKCASTTSKDLGLRICGLQYYDDNSKMYLCVDKYAGRSLNKAGMAEMLAKMLNDCNGKIRKDICEIVLHEVNKMRDLIAGIDGLRLFGASLLIVFEGFQKDQSVENKEVEARLIDFAHATCSSPSEKNSYSGPDDGCLLGLENLANLISNISGINKKCTNQIMATAYVRMNHPEEGQLARRVRDKRFSHHHHSAPHIRVAQRGLTADQPRQRKVKRRPVNFISTDGTTSGDDGEEIQYTCEQEVQSKLDQLLKKSEQLASDLEADCEDNNSTDVDTVSVSGSIKHKNGMQTSPALGGHQACGGSAYSDSDMSIAAQDEREKLLSAKDNMPKFIKSCASKLHLLSDNVIAEFKDVRSTTITVFFFDDKFCVVIFQCPFIFILSKLTDFHREEPW